MPLCLGCAPVRSQAAAMSTPLRASDCARPASLAAVPVEAPEFAAAMAALAPFEPRPAVAAAVSGGPDSLALTFLLHDWLAERGGRLATFTVDPGLRPDSDRKSVRSGKGCQYV